MGRFEYMAKDELEDLKKSAIKTSEMLVDDIDNEIERRKHEHEFHSLKQYWDDNNFRHFDSEKCDFFDCNEPVEYRSVIIIDGERFALWACKKHTNILYNPRHRVEGNTDMRKSRKSE